MRETTYAVQNIGKLPGFAPFEIVPMNEQLYGYRHNTQNKISLSVLPSFRLSDLDLASFADGHLMKPSRLSRASCRLLCLFFLRT